jgi:deoxyribodipyrimidine photo-lyase
VPELKGLEEPYVHDPEEFGRRPAGYPRKIVAHRAARERALAALKTIKQG